MKYLSLLLVLIVMGCATNKILDCPTEDVVFFIDKGPVGVEQGFFNPEYADENYMNYEEYNEKIKAYELELRRKEGL